MKKIDKVKVDIPRRKYGVVTLHRFENIFKKNQFEKIVNILEGISKKVKLLFILHKPTEKKLREFRLYSRLENNKNIELRPRYDYLKFIKLIVNSEFIISDGGSNQEESSYLGIPCLLFRYRTERQEGLGGNVVLSEFNKERIEDFVGDHRKFRRKGLDKEFKPSKIIVSWI